MNTLGKSPSECKNFRPKCQKYFRINRRTALSNDILQTDYDILCLTETWLVMEIPDKALPLAGFNIIRKDKKTSF